MSKNKKVNIFWFRRDLRLYDNKGLFQALHEKEKVIPLFIFDTDITSKLPANDARVEFIYAALKEMQEKLEKHNKSLLIIKGRPLEVFKTLLTEFDIQAVYSNKDHEPYGINRDLEVKKLLDENNIPMHLYLDHLLFDKDDVLKTDGSPYQVFTPYSKKAKEEFTDARLKHYPSEKFIQNFLALPGIDFPQLNHLGFEPSGLSFPEIDNKEKIIRDYHQTRDYPGINGTSRLGVHLRFGTMSIRGLAKMALQHNEVFFNELLWREFYAMILWHYPQVVDKAFKPQYDNISWQNDEEQFERWKTGTTGYPLVDAGMRELIKTGYMHNRVRMVTASFLTKHLLIDWRWGEAWFAQKLLDYELSSNNGGWQWSAGTGCDASPYFRIFNPTEQQKKFDPDNKYTNQWLTGSGIQKHPKPIVEHKEARERCLKVYREALGSR